MLVAMCVTAVPSVAVAADEKSTAGAVNAADKNFMVAAAESGMLEVRLGQLAKKRSAKQEVKDFGAMMMADHGNAGEDLKTLAAKHNVTLPSGLPAKYKAVVDGLGKLSGGAFDKVYIDEMVKAH